MGPGSMSAAMNLIRRNAGLITLLALVALIAVACGGGGAGATASPSPTPHPPLVPSSPGADPLSLIAWLFTPVFQALFIGLVLLDRFTGDIGVAILLLTVVIRIILISP
jgi:hypothetical protein